MNATTTPPAPIDPTAVDAILRPFGESRTLPAEAYRSEAVFDWEREHIFSKGWLCLGKLDDLLGPGQLRGVAVLDESVLLTRDREGRVSAFSNVCRHRGHPLVEVGEAVDARQIRCPYHSWAYRFEGSLRSAPTLTQTVDFDAADWSLVPIRADEWLGWLFINLSGTAGELAATFGNLADELEPYEPQRLVRTARHQYDVAANWKLLVENYHECYHCVSIHPALCEVTPPDSGRDLVPDGLWCGGTMVLKDHAVTMSFDGASAGLPFRGLDEQTRRAVLYVGLFPNLLVSAHPDYVMTHRITPLAAGRTAVECDWLFSPETLAQPGFDPAYAVEFWDKTNWEDWNACERVQLGTGNRGFQPGPLSPWESTIYQVHNMLGRAYR
ncbi:MAG TPA: aromatic ring-hydroxylating dioxygenase subunit alpha, partial [Actinobacteria bacterium]|nr:aromatic ring-hydroxylating dioxygenase subunit alpha [Actinomycetota bacterium]